MKSKHISVCIIEKWLNNKIANEKQTTKQKSNGNSRSWKIEIINYNASKQAPERQIEDEGKKPTNFANSVNTWWLFFFYSWIAHEAKRYKQLQRKN